MSRTILFFGGTGGLGSQTISHLQESYSIQSVGSSVVDLNDTNQIQAYFRQNEQAEVLILFSNYNYNSFIHKYASAQQELKHQLDVNISGITTCIAECLPHMRRNGFGRIIIASSVTVDRNVMGTGIYAAAKAYYENLVKTIAIENASKGITANCIQLGYMDGGLTYTLDDMFLKETIQKIPANRLGTAKEIAATVDFLIKTEYVNGATIKLTGGL
jgi:acetoacetyl-CoA reductase